MQSRARALGHPIHPMLIVFPFGLLATALGLDLVNAFVDEPVLSLVSYWNILLGLATGVVAAVFGLWDWLAIPPRTRAKSVGLLHGAGNVALVALFAAAALLRRDTPEHEPTLAALVLELAGGGLSLVTGWLGGELIYRLGVGVEPEAGLDAPSSLDARAPRPAR